MLTRRTMMAGMAALPAIRRAAAQAPPTIRIGMLQDASGANSILGGRLSLECARQAILDQEGTAGLKVELMSADHRNSPDLGMSIARQWISDGVDAFMEFNNSAVALGINTLIRDTDRVMLANNVGAAALSGPSCTPNMTHWTFDTAMLARVVGNALCDQGGDTWFFIRADYVFGRQLRDDTAAVVQGRGGKVLGESALPLGSTDYASALLQAQSSGAKVVALALAGSDLQNCIKQAAEFGLMRGNQKVASLVMYPQYVHALGLDVVQHTYLTESFYWDLNARSRAFTARVLPRTSGMPPHMGAAGAYSAVRHYLKAVAALGPADAKRSGRATVARMKQIPIEDDVLTNARIREDGPWTLDGSWGYREHDWIARAGSFVYEPAGHIHTLFIHPEPGHMTAVFHIFGPLIYVDANGAAEDYEDVFVRIDRYAAYCRSVGVGEDWVRSLIR